MSIGDVHEFGKHLIAHIGNILRGDDDITPSLDEGEFLPVVRILYKLIWHDIDFVACLAKLGSDAPYIDFVERDTSHNPRHQLVSFRLDAFLLICL